MIKDPEHQLLIEKIETLQKTFDRFYEDFKDDTRARGNMQVDIKNVANTTNALREDVSDQTKVVKRATEDGIEEAIKPVEKKVNKLFTSKHSVIQYIETHKRKSIFSRLKFWKRGDK